MVLFRLYDKNLGTNNISVNRNSYLLSNPCPNKQSDECTPYVGMFPKGRYLFELWGAGDKKFNNGAYVAGKLRLSRAEKMYLFVGGESTYFNSAKTKVSSGTIGNGASDVRLEYDGVWHDFDSLKSRIIVAGAGGNQANHKIGDQIGVSKATGDYGYAGGLSGYIGMTDYSDDYLFAIVYPGNPGEQTNAGSGGHSVHCNNDGESGSFGIAGVSAIGCYGDGSTYNAYSFHGSGGYYGSGGSGGNFRYTWNAIGTGGGSSFISGHNGCDAISKDSIQSKIEHTKLPYHYSGLIFGDTKMIDGSGRIWKNEEAGNFTRMPSPRTGFYPIETGNGRDGFIRITLLDPITYNDVITNHLFIIIFLIFIICKSE